MRTIEDVKVGEFVEHHEKGKGMVSGKTQRTVTITFEKSTSKNTYRYKDAYFYVSEF